MQIQIKKHNKVHNFNDVQLEISRVISNQSGPFTYNDILTTVTQQIREKGASPGLICSARLSEMVSKTLKYYVNRHRLKIQSGKFYSVALDISDISAGKTYIVALRENHLKSDKRQNQIAKLQLTKK